MSKAGSLELFARWPRSYSLTGTFTHLIPAYLVQAPATSKPQNGSTFSHGWSWTYWSRFCPQDTFSHSPPLILLHTLVSTIFSPPMSSSDSTLIMNTLPGFFWSQLSAHENVEMPIDTWEKVCLLISHVEESSPQLGLSKAPCFGVQCLAFPFINTEFWEQRLLLWLAEVCSFAK